MRPRFLQLQTSTGKRKGAVKSGEKERREGEKKERAGWKSDSADEDNKSSHPGVFHPPASNRPPSPSPSRDKRLKEIQNSRKSRSHGKAFVASGLICLIFCVKETSAHNRPARFTIALQESPLPLSLEGLNASRYHHHRWPSLSTSCFSFAERVPKIASSHRCIR